MKYAVTAALSAVFLVSFYPEAGAAKAVAAQGAKQSGGAIAKPTGLSKALSFVLPQKALNFLGIASYESSKYCTGDGCSKSSGVAAATAGAVAFDSLSEAYSSQGEDAKAAHSSLPAAAWKVSQAGIAVGYQEATSAMKNIIKLSASWPADVREKAVAFITGAADGLDPAEKELAEQAMENCSDAALAPAGG